jgi:hypothetical protein
MYFFVVPCNHKAGFILFLAFERNGEDINHVGPRNYFNHCSQYIFLASYPKAGISFFMGRESAIHQELHIAYTFLLEFFRLFCITKNSISVASLAPILKIMS